jgi:hypothetical protein
MANSIEARVPFLNQSFVKYVFNCIPRNEKIKRILDSIPTIEHNFTLARNSNFHKDSLLEALNRSTRYFND